MTRPRKQTVDYFPHQVHHGQTMFILEQKHGNDGYAFWFKLLELLGKTEGHFLDCKQMATWHYLCTLSRVSDRIATEILSLLSEVGAIDKDLWERSKIIWSDNFVKNLAFAYRNREVSIPVKPVNQRKESGICGATDVRNPQMKVNEMKVNGMKEKDIAARKSKKSETPLPDGFEISESVKTWAAGKGFSRLEEHLESFKDYALSRGKTYVDWDSAFKRAIREDWARIRQAPAGLVRQEPKGFDALRESTRRRQGAE